MWSRLNALVQGVAASRDRMIGGSLLAVLISGGDFSFVKKRRLKRRRGGRRCRVLEVTHHMTRQLTSDMERHWNVAAISAAAPNV